MTKKEQLNSYDETPYQTYPFAQTTPEKLATLGTLFGMNPPKIETARVLELGCAEGGNIIPHAIHYPKGQYVGIDLSKVQIDAGLKNVEALGLKNIELKHCSIEDIDASFGKFDYIICHGVFSWVPESVRQKILQIAKENLTENGISYISYNTLPGWNMVRTIRDMMLYHSKNFEDPKEKISQSRALLDFVKESLDDSDTPYSKVLSQEAALLSQKGDHYLRHDHLEDENKQYYFSEFMEEASKNDMQYLSDVSLASMYLGNMGTKIAEKLKNINNIVRTEQYMDYITNRRFRRTLLCHNNIKLNRALNADDAKKFAMSLNITPEKDLSEVDLNSNEPLKFFFKNSKDQNITTSSPEMKAILAVFVENKGFPLKFKTIISKADSKFDDNRAAKIEAELLQNAMNLIIKGYIEISLNERDKTKIKLAKPKLTDLVSFQVKNPTQAWVTNISHEILNISDLDKIVLKYMDGKKTKKQIVECLCKEAQEDNITINKDNKKITDKPTLEKELSAYLDQTIDNLLTQGVLQ